jgi:hypothetical protein
MTMAVSSMKAFAATIGAMPRYGFNIGAILLKETVAH